MERKRRVPKTSAERLRECETHLYFLWDARRLYPKERDRFKQIAAELRVLVCRTRLNKPLLLDLMDEYGFSYDVQPPGKNPQGPPLKLQPVPTVGWREDPAQQRISDALSSGDTERMANAELELAALAKALPFREWVDRGLAVYIAPYDYSNRDLVLAIAQQYGSSHEDDSVEAPILQLQEFIIGGHTGDVAPLIAFADSVIRVGQLFLEFLVGQHGYQPQHFKIDAV